MPQEILIATLAGLGGMIGWGLADFFAKKTIDKMGDIPTLAWGHLFGALSLFALILIRFFNSGTGFVEPDSSSILIYVIFFGILQAIVYLFVYIGFGKGQVSILSPIFASFSGLTALMSIIFFKEPITSGTITALVIVFAGVLLTNMDSNTFKNRRLNFAVVPGFKEIAIATILAALWTLFWDQVIGGQDWLSFTFLMYTSMTIAIFIIVLIKKTKIWPIENNLWKYLFFIGFFEIVAYLALSWGYSITTQTSIIAILSGAFSVPVIILAYLFLKERMEKLQIIGVATIILGIIILSLIS